MSRQAAQLSFKARMLTMPKLTSIKLLVLLSLLGVIALPVYTLFYIYPQFTQLILDEAESDAAEVATHLVSMFIPAGQMEIKEPGPAFYEVDERLRRDFGIEKIKIFNPAGRIIFSSNQKDIGKFNDKSYFFDTVAKGFSYSKLVEKDTASLEGRIVTLDVVETYVPVMRNNTFIGAFEIYYNITDRKTRLEQLISKVYILLSPFAIILVLLAILSMIRASRNVKMRMQVEKTLEVSQAKFHELFNSMSSAISVYVPQNDGNDFVVVDLNRAAERIDAVTSKDVVGKNVVEQFSAAEQYGLLDALRRVSATGNSEYHPVTVLQDNRIQSWRDHYIFKLPTGEVVAIYDDLTKHKQSGQQVQSSMERLRKTLAGAIQAMAMTVETRDPFTAGHQRRVADLARSIAQEMGLDDDQVDAIRLAGLLHDIGKISVPAEILSKPGRLSEFEFDLIKEHPKAGYGILKEIEFPGPVAQIVLQHHERLDGTGYPMGLPLDDILLGARVLAVADVVEAMLSHRPYRPAFSLEKVMEEIVRQKGILYHPEAVDACVRLFKEKDFQFKESLENPVDDDHSL